MKNDQLLRLALRANALFSAACGTTLVLMAGTLSPKLGIPSLALRLTGVVLLPFAVSLWRNAARPVIDRTEARLAVVLDFAWVLGSAALPFSQFLPLTRAGHWAVIGVAECVLLWGILQALGLRRATVR